MRDYHLIVDAIVAADEMAEGDLLNPIHGDFRDYERAPWVNWEHLWVDDDGLFNRAKAGEPLVVAWCRKSLHNPGSPAELELVRERMTWLMKARIYFDPTEPASLMAWQKCESGDIRGTSVEAGVRKYAPYGIARKAVDWRLKGLALVRRPANPACKLLNVARVPKTDAELILEEAARRRTLARR